MFFGKICIILPCLAGLCNAAEINIRQALPMETIEQLDGSNERLRQWILPQSRSPVKLRDPTPITPDTKEWLRKVGFWAATAYCPASQVINQQCGRRCDGPTSGTETIRYFHTTDTDTVGFIGVQRDATAPGSQIPAMIVVSFRGSESATNWIENFKFDLALVPWETWCIRAS